MKNEHTKNNKRLVYTSCFKFTYLGRISVTITPSGIKDYKLLIKGAKIIYDETEPKKDLVFIKKNYKTEHKIPYLTTSIYAFNRTVNAIIETFKNENFENDINFLDYYKNELLDEIQRLL